MGLILAAVTVLRAEYWIERLGDDSIVVREEATGWLRFLGAGAAPALRDAAAHSDPEVVARARWLLRLLDLDRLSPALRRRLPEYEDRSWFDILLDASRIEDATVTDFLYLADRCDLDEPGEKKELIEFLRCAGLGYSRSILGLYLRDPDRDVRSAAWKALDTIPCLPTVAALIVALDDASFSDPRLFGAISTISTPNLVESLLTVQGAPVAGSSRLVSEVRKYRWESVVDLAWNGGSLTRLRMIEFLGICGDRSLLPALVFDPDPAIRACAHAAMRK